VGDISCLPNLLTSFIDMIDTVATERHPDEARRWSYVAPDASREEFGSVSFMPRGNFKKKKALCLVVKCSSFIAEQLFGGGI
jgi:hypothetical protein